jgi:hypothetical protein
MSRVTSGVVCLTQQAGHLMLLGTLTACSNSGKTCLCGQAWTRTTQPR